MVGNKSEPVRKQCSWTFVIIGIRDKAGIQRIYLVLTPYHYQANKFKHCLPQAEPAGDQNYRYMRLLLVNLEKDLNHIEVQQN